MAEWTGQEGRVGKEKNGKTEEGMERKGTT